MKQNKWRYHSCGCACAQDWRIVAMVSILAVIFLGGAATAVAMSKKRA